MFSRSRKGQKRVATKPATIEIVKPEQKEPAIDLTKCKIEIVEPTTGLMINVENKEGEDE